MQPGTVVLAMAKETKGNFRFDTDDPAAVVTSVYVRQDAFADGPAPKRISLHLESSD